VRYRTFITCFFLFCCSFSQNPDINLLRRIHSDSSRAADHTFLFLSESVAPVTIATPIPFIADGLGNHDHFSLRIARAMVLSDLVAGALGTSLKIMVKRQRPFSRYDFIRQKDRAAGPYSFPSNHTAFAFATATSLALAYPKWYVAGPAFLWAGLCAYSRMYLGVHFPLDVLGGMVIGIGSSLLMWELDHALSGR
jgi:membrane-associated phospholipid phosphatase